MAVLALSPGRLQVGTTWGGDLSLHLKNAAEGIDETHKFKLVFKVTGQENGMWKVEKGSKMIESIIDNTPVPPTPGQDFLRTAEYLSPRGFLLYQDPQEDGAFTLDRMLRFWLPESNPESWTVDMDTTTERTVSKARAEFTLAAPTTKATQAYTLSFAEQNGPKANGRMVFDLRTGRLLEAKVVAEKALMPGGSDRGTITLTYRDVQIEKPLK